MRDLSDGQSDQRAFAPLTRLDSAGGQQPIDFAATQPGSAVIRLSRRMSANSAVVAATEYRSRERCCRRDNFVPSSEFSQGIPSATETTDAVLASAISA